MDAKKIASFKWGLGPKLLKTLANNKSTTFNEFVMIRIEIMNFISNSFSNLTQVSFVNYDDEQCHV